MMDPTQIELMRETLKTEEAELRAALQKNEAMQRLLQSDMETLSLMAELVRKAPKRGPLRSDGTPRLVDWTQLTDETPTADAVLLVLSVAAGPMSPKDIATELQARRWRKGQAVLQIVSQALYKLVNQREVQKVGPGKYVLPEQARKARRIVAGASRLAAGSNGAGATDDDDDTEDTDADLQPAADAGRPPLPFEQENQRTLEERLAGLKTADAATEIIRLANRPLRAADITRLLEQAHYPFAGRGSLQDTVNTVLRQRELQDAKRHNIRSFRREGSRYVYWGLYDMAEPADLHFPGLD
jgi:hypothetical protein